jgi:4-hydroxythreonine-4-phosphate dehydrogenase
MPVKNTAVLALTPGEPAGIGPECTIRLAHQHPELCLLVVADPQLLRAAAQSLGYDVQINHWQPGDDIIAGQINCFEQRLEQLVNPGQTDPANAAYVVGTIESAVGLVRAGYASALVTGPVHKGVINDGGIVFSGHTELLAELAGVEKVVMMLAADDLRVALVTTHLPLRDVPDAITLNNVSKTIQITNHELQAHFGIQQPTIQVLGLNPHAGEGGHLGKEDAMVIQIAIDECRASGINALGPIPADTAFTPTRLSTCDAVIAMYHDQGLPVLKHAGFGRAVNITLGLPFIRTSVDHGTALDIAGKNRASATSMYCAAKVALDMCR